MIVQGLFVSTNVRGHRRIRGGIHSRPCLAYSRRAFTLIELLVVIAIIALLLAIAVPSLKKAKESARKMICLSNGRQMGIALSAYLMEQKDRLPPSSCHITRPEQYWLNILTAYTSETLLTRCPSDRSKQFIDWTVPLEDQPKDARWSSFALNALLDPLCPQTKGYYHVASRIRRPGYCIYISESPDSWTRYDHIHPENWGSMEEAKAQIAWDRHRACSSYVFVDGHAAMLAVEQTWGWPGGMCLWFPQYAPGWPPLDD